VISCVNREGGLGSYAKKSLTDKNHLAFLTATAAITVRSSSPGAASLGRSAGAIARASDSEIESSIVKATSTRTRGDGGVGSGVGGGRALF